MHPPPNSAAAGVPHPNFPLALSVLLWSTSGFDTVSMVSSEVLAHELRFLPSRPRLIVQTERAGCFNSFPRVYPRPTDSLGHVREGKQTCLQVMHSKAPAPRDQLIRGADPFRGGDEPGSDPLRWDNEPGSDPLR